MFTVFLLCITLCQLNICGYTSGEEVALGNGENEHVEVTDAPCVVCPRHGICVPKVQCPAHLRPSSFNPTCHLSGEGNIGICCFTGLGHAAEIERSVRAMRTFSPDRFAEDLTLSHEAARQKAVVYYNKADELLDHSTSFLHIKSPGYAHHLTLMSYDPKVGGLGNGAMQNLFATEELKARNAITPNEILLGFTEFTDGPYCPVPSMCATKSTRYRSIRGECNNAMFSSWGSVNTAVERLLPPDYSDGIWSFRKAKSGKPLPNAREISSKVILDGHFPSATQNMMFMQFGQFIAHDISSTVVFTIGNGSAISCCTQDNKAMLPPELTHWACAPMEVHVHDPFFSTFGHRCMNFVRAQLAPLPDCSVGYAKQMNGVSHFLDLSQLYSNSAEKLITLRGSRGYLKVFKDYDRELPPVSTKDECFKFKDDSACYDSGDGHANQVVTLTVMHTIWIREHNKVARALARVNPHWDSDIIFYEARRIVQAEFQHIVYNEWLPHLLGPKIITLFELDPSATGYSSSYDPHVNPSVTAEFAAAAMRFGHSAVDGKINTRYTQTGEIDETIAIHEVMFKPSRMRLGYFIDELVYGLTWQPMQSVDPVMSESLTSYMFHRGNPYGLDLAAINIQRGRDYGIRSYNYYRKLCGLKPYRQFSEFPESVGKRLSSVYSDPEDIDLWIGGLMEEAVEGGLVGPTFANIIADQFGRLKKGDIFFYENGNDVNPGAFTPAQLAEIKKITMSRVLCDNRDGLWLRAMPPDAFTIGNLPGNTLLVCTTSLMPSIDFKKFKDRPPT